jgi:hypothetical protein
MPLMLKHERQPYQFFYITQSISHIHFSQLNMQYIVFGLNKWKIPQKQAFQFGGKLLSAKNMTSSAICEISNLFPPAPFLHLWE